jgi:hypothetical protein
VTDRTFQARLLQWIGYGQYGFMAALFVYSIWRLFKHDWRYR